MKASELQTGDIIKMLDWTSCKIVKFEERYNDNVCERMKILVQKCDNPEQSFYIYPTPDEKIHYYLYNIDAKNLHDELFQFVKHQNED